MAAALAAAAIAIALFAAFLATHHAPVGSVPVGPDKSVKAYQALVIKDYETMANSTSNHCDTIQDQGCKAAIGKLTPTLQSWLGDLTAFNTPSRFVVIDGQLRLHLKAVIAELNAAVAFQAANNQNGFDLAMSAVIYERAWIDPTTFAIEGSYPKVAGTYQDAVGLARLSLSACLNGTPGPSDLACKALTSADVCADAKAQPCESDVQSAATQVQMFLIALTQNPAPGAIAATDAQLQSDLARADTALLGITDALLIGDSAKVNTARSSYSVAITDAQAAAAKIGNV